MIDELDAQDVDSNNKRKAGEAFAATASRAADGAKAICCVVDLVLIVWSVESRESTSTVESRESTGTVPLQAQQQQQQNYCYYYHYYSTAPTTEFKLPALSTGEVVPLPRPITARFAVVLEFFAGTARVTASLCRLGFEGAQGIDHRRIDGAACPVLIADLASVPGQGLALQLVEQSACHWNLFGTPMRDVL